MGERNSPKKARVTRLIRELAKATLPSVASVRMEAPLPEPKAAGKPREAPLLEQVRAVIRFKHYSLRTEQSYLDWIKRFILFHGKRHPRDLGSARGARLPDPLWPWRARWPPPPRTKRRAPSCSCTGQVLRLDLPFLHDVERAKSTRASCRSCSPKPGSHKRSC